MKNKTTLLMILCVAFYSCTIEDTNTDLTDNLVVTNEDNSRRILVTDCVINEIELIAAQNFTAGIVSYEINAEGVLVVTYDTGVTGWVIDATHLYVGPCEDLPTNNPGNPRIGQFPYKSTHSPSVTWVEWRIPAGDFPLCGIIAAHAEVSLLDIINGNVIQEETAWALGEAYGGANWAMYFCYCDTDCIVGSICPTN
ncbi:MAG: hypothetical protein IIB06_02695 [Bacteroidetes bacterium]|nr:hypothetical protein [Bacteroidota bacterium]